MPEADAHLRERFRRARVLRATLAAVLSTACLAGVGCASQLTEARRLRSSLDAVSTGPAKVPLGESTGTAGLETTALPRVEAPEWPDLAESTTTPRFSPERAMVHVRYLADELGVRAAGSREESEAANYVFGQLKSMGYAPRFEGFALPNGKGSRSVVAVKRGGSDRVLVLGAHLDSKPPSPGANDAATGVGALLVIAEVLAKRQTTATIEFAFFGAEEIIGPDPSQHHFGSRSRVATMSGPEKDRVAGMISLDVIGVGDKLYARSMMRGPQTLVRDILAFSKRRVAMAFKKDPGKTGMSDHEPYELAGIPAVWIESLPDPAYHKTTDVGSHIDVDRLHQVGQLALEYVASRTEADLARLRR